MANQITKNSNKLRSTSRIPQAVFEATLDKLTDGSIGSVERLAGIGPDNASRFKFWQPFASIKDTQQSFDAAMNECKRLIAAQTVWVSL